MTKNCTLIFGAALGLLLSACRNEAPVDETEIAADPVEQQAPFAPRQASSAAEAAESPSIVSADAVAVGKAVGPNGAVSAAKAVYSIDDTVHASIPTGGHAAGSEALIYWTFQDGSSHKEERKRIEAGAEYVNFAFSRADGMKTGKYSVQVDVAEKPVGIVDFSVQ